MNSLVLQHQFDLVLVGLGFYPSMIKNDKIAIADTKNDRELRFEVDNREFKTYSPKTFKDYIPEKVKNVISKANSWFDGFEIVKPERAKDPFLFGVKDGKRYFICCWDTEEWEIE